MRRRSGRGATRRARTTSCSSAVTSIGRSSRRGSSPRSRNSPMAAKQSLAFALEPRAEVTFDDYVVDCAWSADGRALAIAGGEGKVALARTDGDALSLDVIGEHLLG